MGQINTFGVVVQPAAQPIGQRQARAGNGKPRPKPKAEVKADQSAAPEEGAPSHDTSGSHLDVKG